MFFRRKFKICGVKVEKFSTLCINTLLSDENFFLPTVVFSAGCDKISELM